MQAGMHTPRGYETYEFFQLPLTSEGLPIWCHLTTGQGCLLALQYPSPAEDDNGLRIIGGTDPNGVPFTGTWPNQESFPLDGPVSDRVARIGGF